MNPFQFPVRRIHSLILAFTGSALSLALYMQHGMGLEPCYLCITQRFAFMVVFAITLVAALHNPRGWGVRLYGGLTAAAALAGAGFSLRQLWLQSLPEDRVPSCGPPADYLFDALPMKEALSMLLQGDGNCAEVTWSMLGISIAGWALVSFFIIVSAALVVLFRPREQPETGR